MAPSLIALDTSVAVPYFWASHPRYRSMREWVGDRDVALCGHAAVETYAVLTRLPGARVAPGDVSRLLSEGLRPPLALDATDSQAAIERLGRAGVSGGAAYDALVAMAALAHGVTLATRDRRALPTYAAIGARVEIAG